MQHLKWGDFFCLALAPCCLVQPTLTHRSMGSPSILHQKAAGFPGLVKTRRFMTPLLKKKKSEISSINILMKWRQET